MLRYRHSPILFSSARELFHATCHLLRQIGEKAAVKSSTVDTAGLRWNSSPPPTIHRDHLFISANEIDGTCIDTPCAFPTRSEAKIHRLVERSMSWPALSPPIFPPFTRFNSMPRVSREGPHGRNLMCQAPNDIERRNDRATEEPYERLGRSFEPFLLPLVHATIVHSRSTDLPSWARAMPICAIKVYAWQWLSKLAVHRGIVTGSYGVG